MATDLDSIKIGKKETAKAVKRPLFDGEVDIIIPFHGCYDRVTRLLESIVRNTRSNRCHICLVDDASPNSSYIDRLTNLRYLKCLRTSEQRGFAGAMEAGFQKTNSPWVVFMHSDCVVEDIGWLSKLGESMLNLKDQGVKMVAPLTNNALDGDPRQTGERIREGDDIILDDTHLSLYCFLAHRELFQRVGFFKHYPYGWYEDEEFAHRMRSKGFRQGISVKSRIYHEGEATIKTVCRDQPGVLEIMKSNYSKAVSDILSLKQ